MQLEVFKGKLLRYRALFTLNRFNSYSIALPSVLGTQRPDGARLPVLERTRQGGPQDDLSGPQRPGGVWRRGGAVARGLLGVAEQRDERQRKDLQVQAERPMGDVVVVPLDALGQRGLST